MKRLAGLVVALLLLLVLTLSLQSCGGDGGGSSDWDEMVWDVDNWG